MLGYIVQFKATNEFLNGQGLKVDEIKYAVILKTEADAIAVAAGQDDDTVILPHEYENNPAFAGTCYELHRHS